MSTGHVPAFLEARRSIRAFLPDPVPRDVLDAFVEAACVAPAPHHSRPWRWVVVDTDDAKQQLATGMGERWRADLTGDGVPPARVDELVDASHTKITGAPAARARLPHVGRPRPLPRRDPAPGRMGHGPAVARRRGREPHARGRRRRATRRAGSRRRSSAPRPHATRSPSTPSGSRTRWSSSACPTRRTSAGPDRRCRSTSSAPTADPAFRLGDAEGTLIASIRPGGRRHPRSRRRGVGQACDRSTRSGGGACSSSWLPVA